MDGSPLAVSFVLLQLYSQLIPFSEATVSWARSWSMSFLKPSSFLTHQNERAEHLLKPFATHSYSTCSDFQHWQGRLDGFLSASLAGTVGKKSWRFSRRILFFTLMIEKLWFFWLTSYSQMYIVRKKQNWHKATRLSPQTFWTSTLSSVDHISVLTIMLTLWPTDNEIDLWNVVGIK